MSITHEETVVPRALLHTAHSQIVSALGPSMVSVILEKFLSAILRILITIGI